MYAFLSDYSARSVLSRVSTMPRTRKHGGGKERPSPLTSEEKAINLQSYTQSKKEASKAKKQLEDVTRAFGKSSMTGLPAPNAVRTDPALAERIRAAHVSGGPFVMAPASFAAPEPKPEDDPAMDALVSSVARTTLANKKAGRRRRRSLRKTQCNRNRKSA